MEAVILQINNNKTHANVVNGGNYLLLLPIATGKVRFADVDRSASKLIPM
jgi:hypothetical protein